METESEKSGMQNLNDGISSVAISPTTASFIAGTLGGLAGVIAGHPCKFCLFKRFYSPLNLYQECS